MSRSCGHYFTFYCSTVICDSNGSVVLQVISNISDEARVDSTEHDEDHTIRVILSELMSKFEIFKETWGRVLPVHDLITQTEWPTNPQSYVVSANKEGSLRERQT